MKKQLIMRTLKMFYVAVITALFGLCWRMCYVERLVASKLMLYTVLLSAVYLLLVVVFCRVYSALLIGSQRVFYLVYSQGLALLFPLGIFYVFMVAFSRHFFNPLPLMGLFAVQIFFSVLWSFAVNRIYHRVSPPRKTVIVYENKNELRKLAELRNFKSKFNVTKYIEKPVDFERLIADIEGFKAVFLVDIDQELRERIIKHCVCKDMQCYVMPHVSDVLVAGADIMQTFSVPFLRIRHAHPNIEYLFFKRAFDIVASLLAIIVASPFMLATALAIKLYDRGPVFYKQVRLTKNRREFNVLKFRSMRTDAEKDGVARLASENDNRITPVGKIIRKIRFDELPQLFNILRGDMTIVGPRPERPEIATQYEKEIPSFGLRLQVKAGLTGYAQVYGRYNTEPYDKLKMDLIYINNMSMVEDLRLMFATIKILFMPESTAGVGEGQVTAFCSEQVGEETAKEKIEELV